ncbi:MAG: 50S ribosomal protein L28 [Omnitrophica WOR_2 bacterium RBG_13_44_8b]|nr:MAG: 50S ribosomal protein L28 [Omnitrophica WOR_2 bacterium RBG_13_44_8b]
MFKKCSICGKGELRGRVVTRKGQYKSKGGTGSKIARSSLRKFLPNLQKMRVLIGGHPTRMYVCAKCIKKGRLQKA